MIISMIRKEKSKALSKSIYTQKPYDNLRLSAFVGKTSFRDLPFLFFINLIQVSFILCLHKSKVFIDLCNCRLHQKKIKKIFSYTSFPNWMIWDSANTAARIQNTLIPEFSICSPAPPTENKMASSGIVRLEINGNIVPPFDMILF